MVVRAVADAVLLLKADKDAQASTLIRHVKKLEMKLGRPKNAAQIMIVSGQMQGLVNEMAVLSGEVQVVVSLFASEDMTVSLHAPRLKTALF